MKSIHWFFFLMVSLLSTSAQATLLRVPGAWLFEPRSVWTDGSTTGMFHPLGDPIPAAGIQNVRVSVELQQSSGSCKVRPAVRWSSDRVVWSSASPILAAGTWQSGNGELLGTAFIDLTTIGTAKPWVQFGVDAANVNAGAIQLCNAALLVEPQDRQ